VQSHGRRLHLWTHSHYTESIPACSISHLFTQWSICQAHCNFEPPNHPCSKIKLKEDETKSLGWARENMQLHLILASLLHLPWWQSDKTPYATDIARNSYHAMHHKTKSVCLWKFQSQVWTDTWNCHVERDSHTYQLVLVWLRHRSCSNFLIKMPPDACHVTNGLGTDWATKPERNARIREHWLLHTFTLTIWGPLGHCSSPVEFLDFSSWTRNWKIKQTILTPQAQKLLSMKNSTHSYITQLYLKLKQFFFTTPKMKGHHSFLQYSMCNRSK